MSEQIRPSDGRRKAVAIDMNVRRFRPDDYVLFDSLFDARCGFIESLTETSAMIGPLSIGFGKILGRVPRDVDTAELLAKIKAVDEAKSAAMRAAGAAWEKARAQILKEYGVR